MDPKAQFPWPWKHVTDTVLVKTGPGALHTIVVNGLTTAGDITVYDALDASDATRIIAILHLDPTTSVSVQPITFTYDLKIATGIYILYEEQATVADLTVTYI